MASRVYIVKEKRGEKIWMIEANNQSQAMRFVTASLYEIKPASAKETVELLTAGKKVYNATKLAKPVAANPAPDEHEAPTTEAEAV